VVITKKGSYRLLQDYRIRSRISVRVLSRGSVIHITQIDRDGKKVTSPELIDWVPQDLPVKKLSL